LCAPKLVEFPLHRNSEEPLKCSNTFGNWGFAPYADQKLISTPSVQTPITEGDMWQLRDLGGELKNEKGRRRANKGEWRQGGKEEKGSGWTLKMLEID
jgi:hypothetical protein